MFSIIVAAGWPIWPLLACSVVGLALIIERFTSLKTSKILPPKLLDEAITVSRNAIPGPDVVTKLEKNSGLGEVLAAGFRHMNANPQSTEDDLRASMEAAGRIVARQPAASA